MTDVNRSYRRILRRETHAARTAPAVVAVLIVLLAAVAAAVGAVWRHLDARSWEPVGGWLRGVASWAAEPATLIGLGTAALVLAVIAIALALLPGRRARRARITSRLAVVIDDGVLADAVADAVAQREGLDRRQVAVRLASRTAQVRVTPTSGLAVDERRVAAAAEAAMSALGFAVVARVSVATRGVVA